VKRLNIKNLLIAGVTGLIFLNHASASTTWGASDCGEWVAESKSNASMRGWLLGFMTGLGAMHEITGKTDNPLSKLNSGQQIYLWMDNYCQRNPLKTISLGGVDLFYELVKK
jgi:hypothetical protein